MRCLVLLGREGGEKLNEVLCAEGERYFGLADGVQSRWDGVVSGRYLGFVVELEDQAERELYRGHCLADRVDFLGWCLSVAYLFEFFCGDGPKVRLENPVGVRDAYLFRCYPLQSFSFAPIVPIAHRLRMEQVWMQLHKNMLFDLGNDLVDQVPVRR